MRSRPSTVTFTPAIRTNERAQARATRSCRGGVRSNREMTKLTIPNDAVERMIRGMTKIQLQSFAMLPTASGGRQKQPPGFTHHKQGTGNHDDVFVGGMTARIVDGGLDAVFHVSASGEFG